MDNRRVTRQLVKLSRELEGGSMDVTKSDVDNAISTLLDVYRNVTSKLEMMDVNKGARANEALMEAIEYLKIIIKNRRW